MDTGRPAVKGAKQARSKRRASTMGLPLAPLPMEWMDAGTWRLPSGKALAEFALQAGFLAPLFLRSPLFSGSADAAEPGSAGSGMRRITSTVSGDSAARRTAGRD